MSLSGFKYSGYLQLLDEKPITAFLNGLYLCNELFASSRNTKVVKLYFQGFKMQRIFLIGCLIFSIAVSATANAWWVIFDEDGNPGVMGGVFFDDPKIGILCAQETYPGTDKPVPIWLSEQLEQIAQENARFTTRKGATRWREIGIQLRTKEDCVPRAERYVYILRRALAENRRYASDPDYLAFNINVVVEHIKRYEQLP